MQYYLIIALQGYCIYHLYKNKNEYYWFFVILFIPLIGCLVYLFTQVLNKKDVTTITEEITTYINPSKKITALQQQLEFSETFQNRILLADTYLENLEYKKAISEYEKALASNFKQDPYTINKLIKCYFNIKDYDAVISASEKIKNQNSFKDSQCIYGLALEQKEQFDTAETELRKVDIRYSNYEERLVLAQFLIRREKTKEAIGILNEMTVEFQNMTKPNKRKYKKVMQEVASLQQKFA